MSLFFKVKLKRGHFWKDKEGKKISLKEFKDRFKQGVEGITPLQKLKTQILGTRIMLLGLFLGLLVSLYGWKNLWWVAIILVGALINTGIQYLGLVQQKRIIEDIEKQFEEPEEKVKKKINRAERRDNNK